MWYLKQFVLLIFCIVISNSVFAQNFEKTAAQQKAAIRSAYKKKRLTQREYEKLLEEQDIIKDAIAKYKSDGYFSSDEKNKIASKQQRAANRLKKYQKNRERY